MHTCSCEKCGDSHTQNHAELHFSVKTLTNSIGQTAVHEIHTIIVQKQITEIQKKQGKIWKGEGMEEHFREKKLSGLLDIGNRKHFKLF